VNDAYAEALWKMKVLGQEAHSRNGVVKRIPYPVTTVYSHPTERMLLNDARDANPFFHIFEAVWLLSGRDDLAFVEQFNHNVHQFAENGILGGAYGHRLRRRFGTDQIQWAIHHLMDNPSSRRAVVMMYDPRTDQYTGHTVPKDIPCNTTIYFNVADQKLNMTVCCRSNDMIWGCYGANAVHMSILQEFVANALDVQVGRYYQMSNDFHIYQWHFPLLESPPASIDPYASYKLEHHVPVTTSKYWEGDLRQFEKWCDDPHGLYDAPFITSVLQPMYRSWEDYKNHNKSRSTLSAATILDDAVSMACGQWLGRRSWEKKA
jgi:thymidylate synthase